MKKINLQAEFTKITDYWNPKIAGELNGQHVKLAKLKGKFIWHHHDTEDEMFLVVKGKLIIEFLNENIILHEGEFLVIPRGVEHRPVADEEAEVLLFEPASTVNTGNVKNEMTKNHLETI